MMQIKNLGFVLLLAIFAGVAGCSNLNNLVGIGNSTQTQSGTTVYTKGKTYIKLEEMRSKKGESKIFFDHPKHLNGDDLTSILSSLYFKEKSITGWGKQKNIFQESELLSLAPHIVRAFSKAAPSQYILVNSFYTKGKGFFKDDLYTILALCISDDKLNVIFSRIHYVSMLENGDSSIFVNSEEVFTDPFSIKRNPFWKLTPSPDQRFKEGYQNWLVIDLEKSMFVEKVQEGPGSEGRSGDANVQGEGTFAASKGTGGSRIVVVESKEVSIKDQLLELKELETTGLITKKDYELRKTQILLGKQKKSVRDRFVELRNLREKGFISDRDYESKKRDILDEDEDSEKKSNIKDVLSEYLELRDEGFISDEDYEYKKGKLLSEF